MTTKKRSVKLLSYIAWFIFASFCVCYTAVSILKVNGINSTWWSGLSRSDAIRGICLGTLTIIMVCAYPVISMTLEKWGKRGKAISKTKWPEAGHLEWSLIIGFGLLVWWMFFNRVSGRVHEADPWTFVPQLAAFIGLGTSLLVLNVVKAVKFRAAKANLGDTVEEPTSPADEPGPDPTAHPEPVDPKPKVDE